MQRKALCSVGFVASVIWLGWRWCCEQGDILHLARNRINWKPCIEDPQFLCGYLEVPTDYNDPSAGTSILALSNLPAPCPASQRLGIILTNYGGPGAPGRTMSFGEGRRIQNVTGSRHDIVSFDQRGLGRSTPSVNCFGSALAYQQFKANTVMDTSFAVPKDPFSEAGKAVLVEQQRRALALEEVQGAMCGRAMGAALGYMSTTTTVHDMEEISRVMEGEDALINFHGGSYGSIVGQYLANMLPHKAGRIYITGVVPADMWANQHYETQKTLQLLLTDAEKVYRFFLDECHGAGPEHCALSKEGDVGRDDIAQRVDAFLDRLQDHPMPILNHTRPGFLTSGGVRNVLFFTLQIPNWWKRIAGALAGLMDGVDDAQIYRFSSPTFSPLPNEMPRAPDGFVDVGQHELTRLTISCGDALPREKDEGLPTAAEIVDDLLVTLRDVSPMFGATVHMNEQHGGCQYWPGTGVGPARYRGPFNKTLATPMLILSNTHDAITPYAAGKIVQQQSPNAHHLVQESAGHSYLAPYTSCALNAIRAYFVNGELPAGNENETRCKREMGSYFREVPVDSISSADAWRDEEAAFFRMRLV
ncbi:hypothetical protein MKEN_00533700 [Mycena kentingensis (nom. inval.)]|nr:hypothetical protein MKEN_00533700 [Mycena kentingensis (nom. inval.)]